MTIFYPDISHYQAGLSLRGAVAVAAKATEGSTFRDGAYAGFRSQARSLGIVFIPYHYLRFGNVTGQADFCFSVAGHDGPLMLDVETGSGTVGDALRFVSRYRALGGAVRLVYLPRWYWRQIGSPDLRPLAAAGLLLVSSFYTTYSDSGPGWAPYGGVTPTVWQYSETQFFNGRRVDFNAYRGTIDQFRQLITGEDMPLEGLDRAQVNNSEHYLQSIVNMTDQAVLLSDTVNNNLTVPNQLTATLRTLAADIAALKATVAAMAASSANIDSGVLLAKMEEIADTERTRDGEQAAALAALTAQVAQRDAELEHLRAALAAAGTSPAEADDTADEV